MEITLDMLLDRKASLESDMLALSGAIQQLDWTIAQLNKAEAE